MKTFFKILAIALLAAAVFGCSLFDKSYYYVSGTSTTGYCIQVTTSDSSLQSELVSSGYTEGTCSANGFGTSHYCTYASTYNSASFTEYIYWGTSYTAATIESACTSSGWTYY